MTSVGQKVASHSETKYQVLASQFHFLRRRSMPSTLSATGIPQTRGSQVKIVKVGQTIEFRSSGRAFPARIVGLRRMDAIEEQRGGLVFPCTAFAGLGVSYGAGISVRNARPDAVRRAI